MKRFLVIFVLAFLSSFSMTRVQAAETPPSQITVGFIPGDDPEAVKKNGVELAKMLQEKTGIPVNIYVSKNYQGLIESMKQKKIDFAVFTASTFVFAEKQAGAKVLLKKVWEGPYYHSVVVTRKDSKIRKIEDLKGKRVAFVDEKSASGYLHPKLMLKKKKIDPATFFKEIVFAGNHQAAVLAVTEGKADAAAIFSDDTAGKKSAWARFSPQTLNQQRVLWISEPIPNDPFCVRQDFYDKYPRTTHDIMFALIELKDHNGTNLLKKLMGVNEMMLATSRQYDPVRELVRELDLKLE